MFHVNPGGNFFNLYDLPLPELYPFYASLFVFPIAIANLGRV